MTLSIGIAAKIARPARVLASAYGVDEMVERLLALYATFGHEQGRA